MLKPIAFKLSLKDANAACAKLQAAGFDAKWRKVGIRFAILTNAPAAALV